jgi:hypothetical protein
MRPLLPALVPLLWIAAAAVSPRTAAAQASTDAVVSYAIVVGSNAGGAGQEDLRFAESDARRVAAVLEELGGYAKKNVRIVLGPTPDSLLGAIDDVAAKVRADEADGRRSLVFFSTPATPARRRWCSAPTSSRSPICAPG